MDDRNMEQQVWQRVRQTQDRIQENTLAQLQRETMELAAAYRMLGAQFTGNPREQALRLYRGENANAAALAGLGILSRHEGERLKHWQPGKESARKVLERCYHRTRRCLTEYMARSADGEYGIVFQKLAEREGEHCAIIAELLGTIER